MMQIKGKKLKEPLITDPVTGQHKDFREYANRRVKHHQPLKVNGDDSDFDESQEVSKA